MLKCSWNETALLNHLRKNYFLKLASGTEILFNESVMNEITYDSAPVMKHRNAPCLSLHNNLEI